MNAEPKTYAPWRLISGEDHEVCPVRITPWRTVHATVGGRLAIDSLDYMVAVVETTKAINRMMGKHEFEGVSR